MSRGDTLLVEQRVAGAIAEYRKVVALDPSVPSSHRALGIAYTMQGNAEKALAEYRLYLKLAPNSSGADQIRKIIEDLEKEDIEKEDTEEEDIEEEDIEEE